MINFNRRRILIKLARTFGLILRDVGLRLLQQQPDVAVAGHRRRFVRLPIDTEHLAVLSQRRHKYAQCNNNNNNKTTNNFIRNLLTA